VALALTAPELRAQEPLIVKFSLRTTDFSFETYDGCDVLNLQFGIPLEDEGLVSLKIYDVSGRAVQTLFSEERPAGYYDLIIPVVSFSPGTYFIRLETQNKAKTEKVVVK